MKTTVVVGPITEGSSRCAMGEATQGCVAQPARRPTARLTSDVISLTPSQGSRLSILRRLTLTTCDDAPVSILV